MFKVISKWSTGEILRTESYIRSLIIRIQSKVMTFEDAWQEIMCKSYTESDYDDDELEGPENKSIADKLRIDEECKLVVDAFNVMVNSGHSVVDPYEWLNAQIRFLKSMYGNAINDYIFLYPERIYDLKSTVEDQH